MQCGSVERAGMIVRVIFVLPINGAGQAPPAKVVAAADWLYLELAFQSDGAAHWPPQVYGADAAQSARTLGSISKDVAEMAWNINSMGLKAPLEAFGKGFFKGTLGYK
jgi:hypothetical protein